MFLIIALLIGAIGASIVFIGKEADLETKTWTFIVLTAIYTLIGWWGFYGWLLSTAWPLFGGYTAWLLLWWIISAVISGLINENITPAAIFPILLLLVIIFIVSANSEMFNASSYSNLIGKIQDKNQKHWSQDIQPLDPTHIRLVPKDLAISLAKTSLAKDGATLGSQFPLKEEFITLQKIKDDYFYLIPLDYKSYTVWTQAKYVPGYVKISATDPYAKPILISDKTMRYTPDAWYGDNLERRLYSKYYNKVLKDWSFEEDDNGNVYWVITVCKPTIGYSGLIVEGVILYDPQTDRDEFVAIADLEKNHRYAWIDRVIPSDLINAYIDYWGDLKDGWWNSFWTHFNLLESETPSMNYSADGRCVFVCPITSNNKNDHAMTGLMYVDARTGKFTYYTTSGGATEKAISGAVNSAIRYKLWHADSSMIVYENVYGKLSSLVPIMGANGNYQGLAIVENENKRVAVGSTPQEALMEFQKVLMNGGGQITTDNSKDLMEYTGKISRLGWNTSSTGKEYYIYFSNFKNSFVVSSSIQSELPLTKEGDEVFIKYIDSKQATIPTLSFKNISLGLQSSKDEKSVNKQINERQKTTAVKADVKDFKESLKNMSDDEIKKLMDKKNK